MRLMRDAPATYNNTRKWLNQYGGYRMSDLASIFNEQAAFHGLPPEQLPEKVKDLSTLLIFLKDY